MLRQGAADELVRLGAEEVFGRAVDEVDAAVMVGCQNARWRRCQHLVEKDVLLPGPRPFLAQPPDHVVVELDEAAQVGRAGRLKAVGYGETAPIASNDTDEGKAQNRRIEFKVIR